MQAVPPAQVLAEVVGPVLVEVAVEPLVLVEQEEVQQASPPEEALEVVLVWEEEVEWVLVEVAEQVLEPLVLVEVVYELLPLAPVQV